MGADVVLDARRPQPWVGDCSRGRHPRGLRQGHLRRWAHAWIYETMVRSAQGGTLGTGVVAIAGGAAQEAGFEWLHDLRQTITEMAITYPAELPEPGEPPA